MFSKSRRDTVNSNFISAQKLLRRVLIMGNKRFEKIMDKMTTIPKYFKKHYLAVTACLFLIVLYLTLSFGTIFINIFNYFSLDPLMREIVKMRILRAVMAFTVGGALSVAGAGYQAVLRNPLAEPFILGISGGASIGAAIAIIFGMTSASFLALPFSAFIGAIAVLFIVMLMSGGKGLEYSNNIILSGVILSTICGSALMFIFSFLDMAELNSVTWWLLGNLEPENWNLLILTLVIVFLGTLILFLYGKEVNAVCMGDEMSYYLGIPPRKLAIIILGIASLLTATVVAISGIIGFVGLIVPHILRKFVGADHRRLFPFALIYGGLFLVLCDTIAKTVLHPQILPAGVVTAAVGGPIFLWILNRKKRN